MQTPEEMALEFTGECEPAMFGLCANHKAPLGDAKTCLHVQHLKALIRKRDAEVQADERERALAEFTEETRTREDGYAGMSSSYDMTGHTYTTTTFYNKPPTRERRLVSSWKKE